MAYNCQLKCLALQQSVGPLSFQLVKVSDLRGYIPPILLSSCISTRLGTLHLIFSFGIALAIRLEVVSN
jgi:hypothetical protein